MIEFGKVATPEIQEIVSIVEELRSTSSTNGKIQILKINADNLGLKELLELTYNPHKKYKLTEKSIWVGFPEVPTENTLTELANELANRNITDYLRGRVANFLTQTDESIRDLYKCVLLKDLKIGVNASTINKVWKGLIPTSETGVDIKPMLASKFDFDKPPVGDFAVTEKLDGIRCMAICKEDGVQLYTRQGKLIEGCKEIEEELLILRHFAKADIVLDGELLADDCDYETVYKETTKRVKNKNEIKTGIHYTVFDILEYNDFCEQKCTTEYYNRYMNLGVIFNDMKFAGVLNKVNLIQVLYVGSDINRLLELLEEYRNKGAEGLMVNLVNGTYEFKRSKNILKVKVMQTVDLRIVGFEEGQGKNVGKLGALLVEYKNNIVGVGSGFSDYEREYIWLNKHMYLDKICEIQFFEETKNKDGGVSLRFPVWKHLRLDKTEPSLF